MNAKVTTALMENEDAANQLEVCVKSRGELDRLKATDPILHEVASK